MPIPVGSSSAATLKASVQVLTFDLYGTVVDMQGGLTNAVTPYLQAKGGAVVQSHSSRGGGERISSIR